MYSIITFGLRSLPPGETLYFSYNRQQKACVLVVGSVSSESFSLEISDGDKIGVIFISDTNAVGLTYNGVVKGTKIN